MHTNERVTIELQVNRAPDEVFIITPSDTAEQDILLINGHIPQGYTPFYPQNCRQCTLTRGVEFLDPKREQIVHVRGLGYGLVDDPRNITISDGGLTGEDIHSTGLILPTTHTGTSVVSTGDINEAPSAEPLGRLSERSIQRRLYLEPTINHPDLQSPIFQYPEHTVLGAYHDKAGTRYSLVYRSPIYEDPLSILEVSAYRCLVEADSTSSAFSLYNQYLSLVANYSYLLAKHNLRHAQLGNGNRQPILVNNKMQLFVRDFESLTSIQNHANDYLTDKRFKGGYRFTPKQTAIVAVTMNAFKNDFNMIMQVLDRPLLENFRTMNIPEFAFNTDLGAHKYETVRHAIRHIISGYNLDSKKLTAVEMENLTETILYHSNSQILRANYFPMTLESRKKLALEISYRLAVALVNIYHPAELGTY